MYVTDPELVVLAERHLGWLRTVLCNRSQFWIAFYLTALYLQRYGLFFQNLCLFFQIVLVFPFPQEGGELGVQENITCSEIWLILVLHL